MLIRKYSDLLFSILVAVLAAAFVLLNIQIQVVRPLLAIMLIVLLGHTVLTVWSKGLILHQAVRIMLSIMLGLALTALTGLFLNYTGWGLTAKSWGVVLSALVIIHAVIAFFQRQQIREPLERERTHHLRFNFGQGIMLLLAALIAGTSIMIAQIGSLNQPRGGYTQLWMTADPSNTSSATFLGIRNEEAQPVTYNLVVMQGNEMLQNYADVTLKSGETWQRAVDFTVLTSKALPIEAVLYRADKADTPYRTVKLWLK